MQDEIEICPVCENYIHVHEVSNSQCPYCLKNITGHLRQQGYRYTKKYDAWEHR